MNKTNVYKCKIAFNPSVIEKRTTGDVEVTVAEIQATMKLLTQCNLETEFVILIRTKEY